MPKTRTTITISKDLLKKAREKEINISSFLEIRLREYIALIESSNGNSAEERTCRDLNPSQRLRRPL